MTINAGIWIDHHQAVVVMITDGVESIDTLQAEPEASSAHDSGGRIHPSYTRNDFVAEDKLQRKAMANYVKLYDKVIAHLHHADSIFIMGPSEAKGELSKRIEGTNLKGRISHVEVADKMTDGQVAAHVREIFGNWPIFHR